MIDSLGNRIKNSYENRTRYYIPRRTYTIIRLDGKKFSSFCKSFKKPFDDLISRVMIKAAMTLAKEVQGCRFLYTQSDEISLLLTDFEKDTTDAWYDGNIQKIASVSAAIATAAFNEALITINAEEEIERVGFHPCDIMPKNFALFDSRVFAIPDPTEVENYFLWRQKDCARNSISALAQSLYSHKELNGKNSDIKKEMIIQKGQNWNNISDGYKKGFLVIKEEYFNNDNCLRTRWVDKPSFDFLEERELLTNLIPKHK